MSDISAGEVRLLSAGAAKGIVEALAPIFRAETGTPIDATFGAVGAMKDRLDSGTACDVIVLSAKLIDALAAENRILIDTIAALGAVRTGVAVRNGDARPAIDDETSLRNAFANAGAIYFPDPERATAGIHFMNVLRKLGIDHRVAARLKPFANGATAMRALAEAGQRGDIGCTQMTEIRYTSGVTAVGPLPAGFDLSTVYSAAVVRATEKAEVARQLVSLLSDPRSRAIRVEGGFEV